MEIWTNSKYVECINRVIASQPQSRAQVVEVPYTTKVSLSPVDFGELLITVIKGNGSISTKDGKDKIEQGDQIHLVEGDEFALLPSDKNMPLVVQTYWAQNILDLLS